MATLRIEAHSDQAPASVRSPVRGKDTLESRNEVNVTVVSDRSALFFKFAHIGYQTNGLCPGHGSSRHFNSAFQGVVGLVAQPVANRCQETMLGLHRLLAHIREHKAPRSVSVLNLSWLEYVAQTGSLLIPQDPCDWHTIQISEAFHCSIQVGRALFDFREPSWINLERLEHVLTPLELMDVHEHGSTRVGTVRHMALVACQLAYEPSIYRSKFQVTLVNLGSVLQKPFHLDSAEVRVDRQTTHISVCVDIAPCLDLHLVNDAGGALVQPNQSVVIGSSFRLGEGHSRLSLVRNSDCAHVVAGKIPSLSHLQETLLRLLPDFLWVMFDPADFRTDLSDVSLSLVDDFKIVVDHQNSGARRSLINSKDVS